VNEQRALREQGFAGGQKQRNNRKKNHPLAKSVTVE
jgi:hypothetical protein